MCFALDNLAIGYLIAICIFGITSILILPVIQELTSRKFESIPHYLPITVMTMISQVFLIIMTTFMSIVMDWFPKSGGLAILTSILYLLLLVIYFVKDIDSEIY